MSEKKKFAPQPALVDCVFLFGMILLSALPYLTGLGFYSDDWSYQATLAPFSGQSLPAMFRALLASDPNLLIRPIQAAFLALEFKVFGRHPLPYHMVIIVMIGFVTILLYLAIRESGVERLLAFVIALLFGSLPHYSTDRIWISSQQAIICMAFALLAIHAFSKSVRPDGRRPAGWAVLGTLALVLSFLSYELAVGFIAASLVMIGLRRYHEIRKTSKRSLASLTGLASAMAVLLAIFILKGRVETRIVYHHHLFKHVGALTWHAMDEALRFNFWTFGMHMPAVVAALYRHSALTSTAFAAAAVIACLVATYLWRSMGSCEIPDRLSCVWLMVVGFVLFGLGYALFFPGIRVNFASAGLANRIEIASALGASCVLVAIVGLVCSLPPSHQARNRTFSLAVALICAVNCLVVSGIGFFWVEASSQQQAILRSLAANVRMLPKRSVLLLDGFCRYAGPGVVFETDWDATGAIQLTLGDSSLTSDVISPNLRFEQSAAETTMYGDAEGHYPYGNDLFVYNVRDKILTPLPSKEAAAGYLRARDPTGDSGCPTANEGDGEKVF